MRNKLYKNDIKVFSFINSEDCQTFDDLINFLKKNNLPVLERWTFNLMGKLNIIDAAVVINIGINKINTYGGSINGNIHHWKYFIKHMPLESLLKGISFESDDKHIYKTLSAKYYDLGWEYVQYMIASDTEIQNEKDLQSKMDNDFSPTV